MRGLRTCVFALLFQLGLNGTAIAGPLKLAAPFSDNAVLQRETTVSIWGTAEPEEKIAVNLDQITRETNADSKGNWRVELPSGQARQSASLTISGSRGGRISLRNIAIGDVWLCSGQSNMEFEASRQSNGPDIVARSEDAGLRLLLVPRQRSLGPSRDFARIAVWNAASPQSVAEFSAVCHAMGQALRARSPQVPVGLISAAWGGSRIEDWLSEVALGRLGGYDAELAALKAYSLDPTAAEQRLAKQREAWLVSLAGHPANSPPVPVGSFRDGWEEWGIPALAKFDGAGTYRLGITIDAATARRARALVLGRIDDIDLTTLNGRVVGNTAGWDAPRRYPLTPGLLRPGRNTLEVLVVDTGGGGGLYGAEARGLELEDGTIMPFDQAATLTRLASLAEIQPIPVAPWSGGGGLATLDHGMIAPLGEYRVKGFAWYQGESNVPRARLYAAQLGALIFDWRARMGGQTFLIVQLAAYGPYASVPFPSGWAALREAQRQVALRDPAVRLIPTMDIGDPHDIHPANKREIGRRLALATMSAGPNPDIVLARSGDLLTVWLPTSYRLAGGSRTPIGFELCDHSDQCRFVDARQTAPNQVEFEVTANDTKLRYLWADSALTSLFDFDGVPLAPFESAIPKTSN